jgi:hypothetical protein
MTRRQLLYIVLAFLISIMTVFQAQGADVTNQVRTFVDSLQTAYNQKDADKVVSHFDPTCFDMLDSFKKSLQKSMDTGDAPQVRMQVLSATRYDAGIMAKIATTKIRPTKEEAKEQTEIFILKPHGNQLKLMGTYEAPNEGTYDEKTRIFSSTKGKYTVIVPEGWFALKAYGFLNTATADSMIVLAPDLQSQVMMDVVQMPLKLGKDDAETAKIGALADVDVEKRMTANHQVFEEGPTRVAGMDGYRIVAGFEGNGSGISARKRIRIYLADQQMLYFLVCDAIGPEQYDFLSPQFEALISSFRLLPVEEGVSRQEAMAENQAQGEVSGQVYTSEEFNCFIAAPEGWEIQTNPTPAHLAAMQYTAGKSIARLVAAKDLPESVKLDEVVSSRIEQVKAVTKEFTEASRRNITLQDTPGIESVQTYTIEGLGRFHIKEWTFIHDKTYYLILCQCIEPDDYTLLEKDFDKILKSFGFIRN